MSVIAMVLTASVVTVFVSVLMSLLANIRNAEGQELTRILVMPARMGGDQPCNLESVLNQIDGIKVITKWRRVTGRHKESNTSYLVTGEDDASIDLIKDIFPTDAQMVEAFKKERTAAIVSDITARELGLQVGQSTELPTSYGPLAIKVVGISQNGIIPKRVVVRYDYLNEFTKNPSSCRFRAYTKPEDYERVANEIVARTKNSASPVQAVSSANMTAYLARTAGMLPAVLGFLGVFLIFVTGLTLANTTAINVRERRIETATLRVLGYRRKTIVSLLLSEAVLVGLIGGVIAVVLCTIAFRNGLKLTPGHEIEPLPPVKMQLSGIIAALVVSVVVPLAGALPAALKSMRIPLVDALRDHA